MSSSNNMNNTRNEASTDDATTGAKEASVDEVSRTTTVNKNYKGKRGRKRQPPDKIPEKKKHTRRVKTGEEPAEEPHLGSFAHERMRQEFGVLLNDDEEDPPTSFTTVKRKVALLLAYCGTNYAGLQINPHQDTIHARLELALYKANLLTKSNFGFPHKYSWSSSARTDKGVHSCAQVTSLKLEIPLVKQDKEVSDNKDQIKEALERARTTLQSHLPSDIVVLDMVRTSKSFAAKTSRDKVRYQYVFPSFLLMDRDGLRRSIFDPILPQQQERAHRDPLSKGEVNQLRALLQPYRATPTQLERLTQALEAYQGTHSFHNFTNGKTAQDVNASRYIINFVVKDKFVDETGMEWIVTNVTGQSFLLHQIRKMICLAVDVARQSATLETLTKALDVGRVHVSLAPPHGLFLDMSYFDRYNHKLQKSPGTPVAEPLDWSSDQVSDSPAVQRWKHFKDNVIMQHIVEEEQKEGNFIKYLYLQEYVFDNETHYGSENGNGDDETKEAE